ncbi:hypothetical protein BJD62_gp47 [Gordonia phage Lucky10]|uniref:Uncharacterized protein n=1 Tax=Gordonia phage Lucky10 TaxID=1821557 RepID=A0A142KB07_9CAUD|nr:hypothetical protein BJD62_gp47 [Gordonia phage Lucky10]AMS03290.1 hypothetical protein SEA_LUCKY10_47 [Gordonia phage Lucky10]
MSGPFPASWPKKCPECGIWWGRGDLVAYDKSVLMHADCARGIAGLRAEDIRQRRAEAAEGKQ